MDSDTNLPLAPRERLLGALIYSVAFPLLDFLFVWQILPVYGYGLSLTGTMLRMVLMSIGLLSASILLVLLLVKQTRRHVHLRSARVAAWSLLAALVSVALLNFMGQEMICRPGACRGIGF